MTVVKQLASDERNGIAVTATENWDKYSSVPYYEISVARDSMAFIVIKTAKTTWRRKFKEVTAQYLR